MSKYRRNAVVIDYNVLPVRPDIESVSKFITNNLELDLKKVKNIQLNNSRNHVIIELGSLEEAWDLAEQHNLRHKVGCRGQVFHIPIFPEDDAVQIRVHDLPPQMPSDLIINHLEAFGQVSSIRKEVWREYFPGIPNGVRVVRMYLEKPIPSFVKVEGELAYIVYNSQIRTCRHCEKPLHHGLKYAESSTISTTTTTTTPAAPKPPAQPPTPTKTKSSPTLPVSSPSATAIETASNKSPPEIATTTTIEPTTSDDEHHTKPTDLTNFQSNPMDISPEDDDDEAKFASRENNSHQAKRRPRKKKYNSCTGWEH